MLRKKCYTVRELFPLRRVNTVLFLDRMPGWKLLPLLTRSFASRGKDVRSRKRTRVERRETTTRWNTTKRAKVWIVIFFGLDPRCRSRARVPFRNSALMFRSIRYGTCSRSVFPFLFQRAFFDVKKLIRRSGETKYNNMEQRARHEGWSTRIYLVVTRSRCCYSDFGNDVIDRFLASTRLARDEIRFVVLWNTIDVRDRDSILDLGSLRSMVEATRHQDEIR